MTPRTLRVTNPDPSSTEKYRVTAYTANFSQSLGTVLISNPGGSTVDLNLESSGLFSSLASGTNLALKCNGVGYDGVEGPELAASNNPVILRKDPVAPSAVLIVP